MAWVLLQKASTEPSQMVIMKASRDAGQPTVIIIGVSIRNEMAAPALKMQKEEASIISAQQQLQLAARIPPLADAHEVAHITEVVTEEADAGAGEEILVTMGKRPHWNERGKKPSQETWRRPRDRLRKLNEMTARYWSHASISSPKRKKSINSSPRPESARFGTSGSLETSGQENLKGK